MCFRIIIFVSLMILSKVHAHGLDELNPKARDIDNILAEMDRNYEAITRISPWFIVEVFNPKSCYRKSCPVWARINLKEQRFYLYQNRLLTKTWLISTGRPGFETPEMDLQPSGRIYESYTSNAYPGGDYQGLGNMPYAVFIFGGYAIHGTTQGNWSQLGYPASKGCIRLLPDNAKLFNRLVRASGIHSVWITVESGITDGVPAIY